MSDSVTKYFEMLEDGTIDDILNEKWIFESPDGGKTVTRRPFNGNISQREVIKQPILSEGHKRQAYNILVEYPEEAILEAARILRNGK